MSHRHAFPQMMHSFISSLMQPRIRLIVGPPIAAQSGCRRPEAEPRAAPIPAMPLSLQSLLIVGRVAELGSLGIIAHPTRV